MALPKYKTSKSNTRTRKAVWLHSLKAPAVHTCPNCSQAKQVHRACPSCGFYNGKYVPQMKRTEG